MKLFESFWIGMKSTTSPTPSELRKRVNSTLLSGRYICLCWGLIVARDVEEASFALIENCGEDAWRVDLRKATPVDRTVYAHQCGRVQVADDGRRTRSAYRPFRHPSFKERGLNAVTDSFSTFRTRISIQKDRAGGRGLRPAARS